MPRDRFKASRSWVHKFMRRTGFLLRRRTSICQKRASVSDVARWINNAWEALPSAVVSWAFLKCCLSNSPDGTDDDAVFADSDRDSSSEEE